MSILEQIGMATPPGWPWPEVQTVHALIAQLGAAGQPISAQEQAVRQFMQTPEWEAAPGVLQRDVRRWLGLIWISQESDLAGGSILGQLDLAAWNPAWLLGSAGGRAAGGGGAAGGPDPAGSILSQLDLAWHYNPLQPRDRHGRWTKTPGGGMVPREESGGSLKPNPEGYPGQFSDRLLHYWRHEADPDAKQALNMAGASYDAGDYRNAAKYLRRAAKTAANLVDPSRYGQLAADIEGKLPLDNGVSQAVKKAVDKSAAIVPGLIGPDAKENAFSGKVDVVMKGALDTPYTLAQLNWDGRMVIREDVARTIQHDLGSKDPIEDPTQHVVILHELIHGIVPKGSEPRNRAAYQDYAHAQIEEGFTELGAIHHAPEYFDKMGIGNRELKDIIADGAPDNPEWDKARDSLAEAIVRKEQQLRAGPQGGWNTANALVDARYDVIDGDLAGARDALQALRHTGHKTDYTDADALEKQLKALEAIPPVKHATMAEYARRIQDPARIASRDGTQIWGHYPDQVADAQDWVQQVAMEEGYGDLRPGTPGWKRVVQLTNDINEEGTADKLATMARQLAFATVKDPKLADDPQFMNSLMDSIQENIRDAWGKPSETRAKDAFTSGKKYATGRVQERLMSEQLVKSRDPLASILAQAGAA